jgi:hypothetical protein
MAAARSPSSEPANSQFLRLSATLRMARSAMLLLISGRPSWPYLAEAAAQIGRLPASLALPAIETSDALQGLLCERQLI